MRIVQIVESLEVGGAERVVVNLVNALANAHDVLILCTKRVGALAEQLSSNIRVECLNKSEGNDWRLSGKLTHGIRDFRADAVHSHHWGVLLDAGLAVARTPTRAFVHTVHGKYPAYASGFVPTCKRSLRHFLERQVTRKATAVVCVSDALVEYVEQEVGIARSRISVIVNGTAIADPPARAHRATKEIVLAAVGRLAAVKNYALLLRAVALLVSQGVPLKLKIVGDGPERTNLETQATAAGIDKYVEFLGFRADVAAILSTADMFVLSSVSEGLPMAALEAMQVCLPIVATRVGGMPQVVREGVNGFLVESGNAEQLADRIRFLADHPDLLLQYGAASRAHLVSHFSADAMVDAYSRLYKQS